MKKVLVVTKKTNVRSPIIDELFQMGFEQVRALTLDRIMEDGLQEADGIVVDADENFNTFLKITQLIDARHPIPVVMLYGGGNAREECMSGFLFQPFCQFRFPTLLRAAIFQNQDFCDLCQENNDLKKEIEDRNVIERAKWILVKREGISEDIAYKRIRTSSMNYKISMREVALRILEESPKDLLFRSDS